MNNLGQDLDFSYSSTFVKKIPIKAPIKTLLSGLKSLTFFKKKHIQCEFFLISLNTDISLDIEFKSSGDMINTCLVSVTKISLCGEECLLIYFHCLFCFIQI